MIFIKHKGIIVNKINLIFILLFIFQHVYANDSSKFLSSKSVTIQAEILTKLLHQSGKSCGEGSKPFMQGFDKDNVAYWNLTCSNGKSWLIQLPSNSSSNTRLLECENMTGLDFACYKKL